METRHGFYRERTWAPAWVVVILLTACLAAAGAVAYELYKSGPGGDGSMSMLGAVAAMAASLGLPILLGTLFARLDVEVQADQVYIAFGPIHLCRKRIPFSEIEAVRGLTYRPLREFGGWGIRPRGGKTAWTIRGNQAVKVTLSSGKDVYVGSLFPQRLEERIRTAMRAARGD